MSLPALIYFFIIAAATGGAIYKHELIYRWLESELVKGPLFGIFAGQMPKGHIPGVFDLILFLIIMFEVLFIGLIIIAFIRELPFALTRKYSAAKFIKSRAMHNKPLESSAEENRMCIELLNSVSDYWTHTIRQSENNTEREASIPENGNEIADTRKIIKEIAAYEPTDEDIVKNLNNELQFHKKLQQRQFAGSNLVIVFFICLFVVPQVIMIYTVGWAAFKAQLNADYFKSLVFHSFPLWTYFFAFRMPKYLAIKYDKDSRETFMDKVFSPADDIPTDYVKITYNDGTTEIKDTNAWVAAIILVTSFIVHTILLVPNVIFRFFRNYIFYF